jgi:hypothetical protein
MIAAVWLLLFLIFLRVLGVIVLMGRRTSQYCGMRFAVFRPIRYGAQL